MALWLIRAGQHGEDEKTALNNGLATIGWLDMPDVSAIKSYEEMKQKHSEIYLAYSLIPIALFKIESVAVMYRALTSALIGNLPLYLPRSGFILSCFHLSIII